MTVSEQDVIPRFGNRPGFRLVSVGAIGLPVFRVSACCLVMQTTPVSVIDEFLLRALRLGVNNTDDLCRLLGLPARIVLAKLADMFREGLIQELGGDPNGVAVCVSRLGETRLRDMKKIRPREINLQFTYDGLTHKTTYIQESYLNSPKQLRALGIPELPPIPAKGPDPKDLSVNEITRYLKDGQTLGPRADNQVLRVLRVDRRERRFVEASALIFKGLSGDEYQVAFVVDGRLSNEHEAAFRRNDGIDRVDAFSAIRDGEEILDLDRALGFAIAAKIRKGIRKAPEVTVTDESQPGVQNEIDAKASPNAGRKILSLKKKAPKPISRTDHLRVAVNQLSVVEHNPLMLDALRTAKDRVIIVSPWVRREVVNSEFLEATRNALEKGVQINIGYGIKSGVIDQDMDPAVGRQLDELSREFPNLVVRRLGDTHAKILVKDSEYFVVTSFNWLSFRGDPDRRFREEWGTIVRSRGLTEDFVAKISPRLS